MSASFLSGNSAHEQMQELKQQARTANKHVYLDDDCVNCQSLHCYD